MRAALLIVVLASTLVEADPGPSSWIGTDVVMGDVTTDHATWNCFGFGLAVSHVLIGRLDLRVEALALNLDASAKDDHRHGFALRGGGSVGYRLVLSKWGDFEWALGPELGVTTSVAFGLGVRDRTNDDVYAGIRASMRTGNSRGLGATIGVRFARSDDELTSTVTLGYDWGL